MLFCDVVLVLLKGKDDKIICKCKCKKIYLQKFVLLKTEGLCQFMFQMSLSY
jgi:hypothetical protein